MLFGWAETYGSQLLRREGYDELCPVRSITALAAEHSSYRELCVMKECGEQFRIVIDDLSGFKSLLDNVFNTERHEVRHLHILHVLPTLLHRIQLRRIRWQIFKHKPIRMRPKKS
jgi:hypothetical protein